MDLRTQNFGIEIETICQTRERVAQAIQTVVGGQVRHAAGGSLDPWEVQDLRGRIWKVVADASLTSAPAHLRAEIVSPILRYEDMPELQEVVRAVRRAGAKVDEKCGIHVHVDAQAFDGRTLGNLAKIVYKQEALILHALGVSQERLARYTRPVSTDLIRSIEHEKPRTKEHFNRLWYGFHNQTPQHYDGTRYHGVNLHNVYYRGTVEFRWFEATLHAGKVKAYVQLCLAIAAKALASKSALSAKRTFSSESAKYDFRVFLLGLKMIGEEFRTARLHLLERMPGDAAFKRGPAQRAAARAGVCELVAA